MWTPDPAHMQLAFAEALRGAGRTHPNPSVGAVVVKDGAVVGTGFHIGPGNPHAEVVALRAAGERARGADLYVSLEPCCTTGRTGPCTEAISAAGVSRVAAAVLDPNPQVSGRGIQALRDMGIVTSLGFLERDSVAVDPAYHGFYRKGRPYVHLKWAQTLDGRVVIPGGGYITGPEARLRVHFDRYLSDAILVSASTVEADDPLLTIRLEDRHKTIARVILDHQGRLTGHERIFLTCPDEGPVWIVRPPGSEPNPLAGKEGVAILDVATAADGRFPLSEVLQALKVRGIMGLYVEAVGGLSSAFLRAGLVDKVSVHVAPLLAGPGPGPAALEGVVSPAGGVVVLEHPHWERAGADWIVTADVEDACSLG
jgi:diaminohydroxyphosphoribosylaminopyrimidine deaminase / 5-amino-6-(5-phosphoribosylamino)uracil reductase